MTDVLDMIDGALRDWETSTDAMRWTPDPPDGDRIDLSGWANAGYVDETALLSTPCVRGLSGGTLAAYVALQGETPIVILPGGWVPNWPAADLRPQIRAWLTANRIDPMLVPVNTVPAITRRWIYWESAVYDRAGDPVFDAASDEWLQVPQRSPLLVEPPAELWPWWATSNTDVIQAWWDRWARRSVLRHMYAARRRARQGRRR